MEEDQEIRHVCKLCGKSFPCGRSLGGHMRSHVIMNNSADDSDGKITKRKLPFTNNGGNNTNPLVYVLRENPKKTCRFAASSKEEAFISDKLCKECGKGFVSWKALFGHMKCHSEKEKVSASLEEENSVMDSQSDNETAAPSRRRRSKRRTRSKSAYAAAASADAVTASSSFSIVNASSSTSEIEQEQEEVAMCLIMLSRDVGHWGFFNSGAPSSDEDSEFLDKSIFSNLASEGLEFGSKKSIFSQQIETFEAKTGKNLIKEAESEKFQMRLGKYISIERKLSDPYNSMKSGNCRSSAGKNKFECITCNKMFYSYQALGGHRASHKKIKGCFASNIESSIEAELSNINLAAEATTELKKSKDHECPICLKVFSSGQALGGHKRSHLIGNSTKIQKPDREIRDLLDLNLPAPAEEESHGGDLEIKPWWDGNRQKNKPLVSLISDEVL